MKLKTLIRQRDFENIAGLYVRRTGLPVFLSDPDGKIIYSTGLSSDPEKELGISREMEAHDRGWRVKAVDGSYRWGDAYFSSTPLGLIAFSVPVTRDGRLYGAFISGFIIFPEMKRDIAGEITRYLEEAHLNPAGAVQRLHIKTISREKTKKHAAYLMELARKFNLCEPAMLSEKKEKISQQTGISGFLEHIKGDHCDVARMIIGKQHEILQKIRLGDLRGAREILNEYLGSIFLDSGMKFDVLKIRLIELIIIISRSAIESGVNSREILDLNCTYFNDLIAVDDIDELCHRVSKILEDFIVRVSSITGRRKTIEITKMLDHVRGHFTERITASGIARVSNLSVSRALHLFREETGFSLTEYVKKLRIEYCKYLLLTTGKSLAEIAHEAGFFDQSHFARNFSLLEKITPREYRNRFSSRSDGAGELPPPAIPASPMRGRSV